MDLIQQPHGDHYYVHSVSGEEIRIVDKTYSTALIVTAQDLITDWPVKSPDEIRAEHLEQVLHLNPEVVLIGTGQRQVFLAPELLMLFYQRGIGVEMMTTQAACRTFNVLISEDRKVAAALLPPSS
jgi:uncharacterized protein